MAKQPPKRLGRGLDVLLGAKGISAENVGALTEMPVNVKSDLVKEIPLDEIEPNPSQPRVNFDEEQLAELANSIKELGIIQPIVVRPSGNNKYQIISGERRWRASRMVKLKTVPVYVRDVNDRDRQLMAMVENVQRKDLDAMEIAIGYQLLLTEYNLTQEEVAKQVGQKRSTVANYMRLLKLPEQIQHSIREQTISMGHARALISLDDVEAQKKLAQKIIEKHLSVRQVEELVKDGGKIKVDKLRQNESEETDERLSEAFFQLAEEMQRCFNSKVNIKRGISGGAKLTLDIKTDKGIVDTIEKLKKLH
ncbi:MAG: ParB/RepB/Spo0J family partition protein [Bacteroidales bacterium]